MMNRITWVGAAAALSIGSPVLAADLLEPTRMAAQRPALQAPLPAPMASPWSGLYVGIHMGAGVANWDRDLGFVAIDCTPCRNGDVQSATFGGPNRDDTALLGGVQAGYNWHVGAVVLGFEADWSMTGLRDRTDHSISSATLIGAGLGAITTPVDGFAGTFRSDIDWLATARGRIGLPSGNLLFYGTGGLAFADTDSRASFLSFSPARSADPIPVSSRENEVRVGWTVGAGIEAALASNLSAKIEYLYADLGRDRRFLGAYIDAPNNLRQYARVEEKIAIHSVKLGLNYRFAGP
jgi:outer membrane immunogenic protein